jgi:predicted Zn-dependent protease
MERAQQTCETWATTYPRDDGPPSFLGGFIDPTLGEYEQGVAAAERIIELTPDHQIGYIDRAFNLIALGRLEEAKETLRTASERGIEVPFSLITQHDIAFLKADKSEMDQLVARARENSDAEIRMSDHQAAALAFSGRLQQARILSQHAIDAAQQTGYKERAGFFATRVALREAFYGNVQAAVEWARKARELGKGREVEYGAAFALALSGASSQAEALGKDLEKHFPEDTAVRFSYLPALRARLALNHHHPSIAIENLQSASHYELGSPRSAVNAFFGAMYPVYVRGEAYLAEHRGVEAAAEFQKILDHRGIVVSDPIGALAPLQIGRAYVESGEKAKAKSAYKDFFTVWQDADPDIPILQQAHAEYAKL